MVAVEEEKPRIRFVRLYLGENRMDVAVGLGGKTAVVKHSWYTITPRDTPEGDWHVMTMGELRIHRDKAHKKASGRLMPWDM